MHCQLAAELGAERKRNSDSTGNSAAIWKATTFAKPCGSFVPRGGEAADRRKRHQPVACSRRSKYVLSPMKLVSGVTMTLVGICRSKSS